MSAEQKPSGERAEPGTGPVPLWAAALWTAVTVGVWFVLARESIGNPALWALGFTAGLPLLGLAVARWPLPMLVCFAVAGGLVDTEIHALLEYTGGRFPRWLFASFGILVWSVFYAAAWISRNVRGASPAQSPRER